MRIDYAIVCDRLGFPGAAQHETYELMAKFWASNEDFPVCPPHEVFEAEWRVYLAELRTRYEPLRERAEAGERFHGQEMVTVAEAREHLEPQA